MKENEFPHVLTFTFSFTCLLIKLSESEWEKPVSSLSPTFFHFHFHLAADKTFRKWMREDGVLPFSHVLLFPAPDFVSHTSPSRLTFWRHFESQQIGSKEASYCKMQRLCQSWSDLSTGKRQVLVKNSQSRLCHVMKRCKVLNFGGGVGGGWYVWWTTEIILPDNTFLGDSIVI